MVSAALASARHKASTASWGANRGPDSLDHGHDSEGEGDGEGEGEGGRRGSDLDELGGYSWDVQPAGEGINKGSLYFRL